MGLRPLKVALSKPMTARFPVEAPFDCIQVADESLLTWYWGKRFRPPLGDLFTQAVVIWQLFRHRRRADVLVAGRYADGMCAIQALLPVGRRPLLLLDNEWMLTPRTRFRTLAVRGVRKLTAKGASRLQVFCEAGNNG